MTILMALLPVHTALFMPVSEMFDITGCYRMCLVTRLWQGTGMVRTGTGHGAAGTIFGRHREWQSG